MPIGQTEEKLRGMGCTMDQRKRLMMAAKFGLGPLQQLGLDPKKNEGQDKRSRSRSPQRMLPAPGLKTPPPPPLPLEGAPTSSSSRAMASASSDGPRVLRQPMIRAAQPAAGPMPGDEDDQDVNSFLAGGRAMAVNAQRAQQAARARVVETQALSAASAERDRQRKAEDEHAEQRRLEDQRREKEREKLRLEEKRLEEEEERRREEKRKVRAEEKRRRKEDKAKQREQARREAGLDAEEDVAERDSSEEAERRQLRPNPGGVFKEAFRGDMKKRNHWGESVKGRVSNDYKGFSDADLDRRFGLQQQSNAAENLMTEAQVLAMLRKSKDK